MSITDALAGLYNPPVTQLYRPLMGAAQGSVARVIEEIRQVKWDDSAYTEEQYYGLSLRGPGGVGQTMGGLVSGNAETTFIFPVGPQAVRVSREYRQTITPTLGGLVTEERGIAWRDITIEGNFGLAPKFGYDTTSLSALSSDQKLAVPWKTPLSGPKWTQRMFSHYLDRYGAMKARPDENYKTTLVWHDFKNDEHWIVVPIKVELNRTINDRMMYPFSITFRAVSPTTATAPLPRPPTIAGVIAASQNAIRAAREAVSLLTASADTLTAALGQVRYYVATIDSVLDEMTNALAACQNLAETGNRFSSDVGGMFMRSATEMTEVATKTADENQGEFPEEVRQSLYTAVDQYDRMAAQASLQADDSREERVAAARENAESSSTSSTSSTALTTAASARSSFTGRTFSSWEGWVPYIIRTGDTLVNIAARMLNDPSKWYEIAVQNGLRAPYISASGLPGTAGIGDTIMIPAALPAKKTATASVSDDASPEALYGRDIKLFETTGSRPGRTQVDIRIDPKTGKDVATIAGVPNLVQACQMKLWVEQGTAMIDPSYGTPLVVGYPNVGATLVALRSAIRSGLSKDSRIEKISSMIVVAQDDMVDVEATVIPVGTSEPVTIGISVL